MKILKRVAAAVISVILICMIISFIIPEKLYDFSVKMQYSGAGLVRKEMTVDNHRIVYFEGGSGSETFVLIHGLGADKTHWIQLAKNLPGYHFIIPDLPGFGESSKLQTEKYDVESQVGRLDKFLVKLGLKKFYIAGNSMGGNISALYAVKYPDKTKALILLDNLGINSPEKSEIEKLIRIGENPLVVKNRDGFKKLMKALFVKEPYIPYPLQKVLADRAVKNGDFIEKVFKDLIDYPVMLERHLAAISMPTLIIWGDKDQLLDVSSVQVLEKGIKNHTTRILKDCGHLPMMERPVETAGYIKAFIGTLK